MRDAGYEPRAAEAALAEGEGGPGRFFRRGIGCCRRRRWCCMLACCWSALDAAGLVQFLLATPVQFWLGRVLPPWHALRRSGNMELLVSIGTTAAWLLSMWL